MKSPLHGLLLVLILEAGLQLLLLPREVETNLQQLRETGHQPDPCCLSCADNPLLHPVPALSCCR